MMITNDDDDYDDDDDDDDGDVKVLANRNVKQESKQKEV